MKKKIISYEMFKPIFNKDMYFKYLKEFLGAHNLDVKEKELKDYGVILEICGELEKNDSCIKLKEKVFNLIRTGKKVIIFDLKELTLVGSNGIACFLVIHNIAIENNVSIVFVGIQEYLKSIFEITNLNKIFDTYDDIETAINYIRPNE